MNSDQIESLLRRTPWPNVGSLEECPDEAALAAYVAGPLARRREELEQHLARCSSCLGQVSFLIRSQQLPETGPVSPRLLNRVRVSQPPVFALSMRAWVSAAAALIIVAALGVWQSRDTAIPAAFAPEWRTERTSVPAEVSVDLLSPREGDRLASHQMLRWTPLRTAVSYEVQMLTAEGDLAWETSTDASSLMIPDDVRLRPGRHFLVVKAHLADGRTVRSRVVGIEVPAP